MTRTRPVSVVLFALVGAVVGFILDLLLASAGAPVVAPPLSLAITVIAAALIVVALAIPIQRAIRGSRGPINPFRAMRVVLLAKASSLCGGLILGFGAGIGGYLLTRPVVPGMASLWLSVATVVSGLILLVAGLIAERLCTLPPDERRPGDEFDGDGR